MNDTNEQQQPEKRKRGRPRIYPPKPPKPKLTKEELSKVRRAAWEKGQLIRRATGRLGGRPKGTTGEGYHRSDNIAVGEERVQMSVLRSSSDVFHRLASAWDTSIISAVKTITDGIVEKHPELFSPDAPQEGCGDS